MLVLSMKIYMSVGFPGFEGAKTLIIMALMRDSEQTALTITTSVVMMIVAMPRLKCHVFKTSWGPCHKNVYVRYLRNFRNKLECLSLTSL